MTEKYLIVVGKSGVYDKTAKTGRSYQVRYLTCEAPDDPYTAYKLSIYPTRMGEWPDIFVFSTILVPYTDINAGQLNSKFDIKLDGAPFIKAVWINGFKQQDIKVVGRYSTLKTIELDLAKCNFYTDHVSDADGQVSLSADELGFKWFPPIFKKGVLEGTIKITGEFEMRLQKVNSEWVRVSKYKIGSINLAESDLSILRQIINSAERDTAIAKITKAIHDRLAAGTFMSIGDVEEMLKLSDIIGMDAEKLLYGATFKKDYEPAFFTTLKEIQDQSSQILYSEIGFLFHINRCWVWEVPEYGAATYLFNDKILTQKDLAAVLSTVNKIEIIQSDEVKAVLGFIRRVIHPKDPENDAYFDRWLAEVQRKL